MFGIGYCGGMSVVAWALMIGFWVAVIGLVIWAVSRLFPTRERPADLEKELDRRLASGELDVTSYRHLRDELVAGDREHAGR